MSQHPAPAASIIVVDDDDSVRDALAEFLTAQGYDVRTAEGGGTLDRLWAARPATLLIVDVMMPDEGGLSLCRRYAVTGVPILMLSAPGTPSDKAAGLELGAWDYLAKPFEPRELLARVRALLRRPDAVRPPGGVTFAGWWLEATERRLRDPSGRPVNLTDAEHALLTAFAERPGRVLSRNALLDAARGVDAESYDRAVDLAVSRLRRKLAAADPAPLIETIRGAGYRFVAEVIPA